jgi:hypothetical protein
MKRQLIIWVCLFSQVVLADGLPVISLQPTNLTVFSNTTATLVVGATGASGYQWRFNGADMPQATNSTLQIANVQAINCGYYVVVAKNSTGWVPSQMAYLSIDYTRGGLFPAAAGMVPFSNQTNNYFQGQVRDYFGSPVNNGQARVFAGPQLDQLRPFGTTVAVANGYYGSSSLTRSLSTVAPGQNVYYQVVVTYTNSGFGYTQPSTVMNVTAGGGSFPVPSVYGLKFPAWWAGEGLEPVIVNYYPDYPNSPTNQARIPGETFSLTNVYFAYTDYGTPTAQWRKNGSPIIGATNFPNIEPPLGPPPVVSGIFQGVLTITNVQPEDAGIYDLMVYGNEWIVGPKTTLSIQVLNGSGTFQSPRFSGTSFVCDLLGVAGRNYAIQWSTNLTDWHHFTTQYNSSGTITFSNSPTLDGAQFYRARLLP